MLVGGQGFILYEFKADMSEAWFRSMISHMASPFNSLDSIIGKKGRWFGFQVQLNAHAKSEGNHSASMETPFHSIDLYGLRQNVPFDNDGSHLLQVLEMVFPDSKRPPRAPRDSEAHNLAEFEVSVPWRKYYAGFQIQLKGN